MPEDRTEKATARQRQKAAERGDRAHSRDLMAAAAMLAGALVLGGIAERWMAAWARDYRDFLALGAPALWESLSAERMAVALRRAMLSGLAPVVFLMGTAAAAAVLVGIAQGGGWSLNFEALQIKPERLNPAENLKNVFSLRGAARCVKSLVPVAAIAFCAERAVAQQAATPPMSLARFPELLGTMENLLLDAAWIFLGWSAVDYVMEWRSRESRLRMSKQDVRDEFRETEGNPQVKGRIRSLRRQMRRRQLKADISRASVIVTNPTHYAVALSFDFETMEPPKMVAKGRDLLAAIIREEAQWAGIPMVENPPLARSLYKHVEPGQAIPFNLYAAVAGILAYLYRQQVAERVRREQQLRARERS